MTVLLGHTGLAVMFLVMVLGLAMGANLSLRHFFLLNLINKMPKCW
ncbi:hypothetical protein [Lacticaseibacillus manihotivorans]|nr:hypothetical protein [Lacticaseibacillus manihotivorans]